ncbi:MAG: GNAT family N-acetyltransferase [Christensenellaceae bacterium]|jgi:predicted acetyltransferase|nr:GNAT family N-acetyltransferase [Christensenellaceae bacterium]
MELASITQQDLMVAGEILKTVFPNSYGSGYLELKKYLNGKSDMNLRPYLIILGDVTIGTVGLFEYPEYNNDIWLWEFAILPQYRGKGYGKQVLSQIIELAKEDKSKQTFRLWTYEGWNKDAQPLYNKYMQLKETYSNRDDSRYEIENGKPLVYTFSLTNKKPKPFGNKFLDLGREDRNHKKGVRTFKADMGSYTKSTGAPKEAL